jgi:hypothetical protein
MILLNSQSMHSTFFTRELLTKIRPINMSLTMLTNGGIIFYTQQSNLRDCGTVWFNHTDIANIISMSEAKRKGHTVSYSPLYLKITNMKTKRAINFHITREGLYES